VPGLDQILQGGNGKGHIHPDFRVLVIHAGSIEVNGYFHTVHSLFGSSAALKSNRWSDCLGPVLFHLSSTSPPAHEQQHDAADEGKATKDRR